MQLSLASVQALLLPGVMEDTRTQVGKPSNVRNKELALKRELLQ